MDKHLKTLPKETIPEFYAGRSVFITGATGFMGKVLIEKLLRSCPDVSEIFLLMRAKKNMTIDQRVQKMITLPVSSSTFETHTALSYFFCLISFLHPKLAF